MALVGGGGAGSPNVYAYGPTQPVYAGGAGNGGLVGGGGAGGGGDGSRNTWSYDHLPPVIDI